MDDRDPRAVWVRAGADRHGPLRSVFGLMPFTVKVAAADTGGACLVIEQANEYRGGPPRHLHHAQDEWFYVVAGRYRVEIDGTPYDLGPGDAILAPRNVPHGWALVGPLPGRMVIAFTPAGDMEGFFEEASAMRGLGTSQALADLFARHGMRMVGPPLDVGQV